MTYFNNFDKVITVNSTTTNEGGNRMPEQKPKLDIEVQLTGEDGNVFNLMGIITTAMKRNGHGDSVEEFTAEVWKCGSYEEALQTFRKWVHVR